MDFSPPGNRHLPKQLRVVDGRLLGQLHNPRLIGPAGIEGIRDRLRNCHLVKGIAELIQGRDEIRCVLRDLCHQRQHLCRILLKDRGREVEHFATVDRSQHFGNLRAR